MLPVWCVLFVLCLISRLTRINTISQVALFKNIKALFANKPVLLLINKVDVTRPEQLSAEDQAMLQELAQEEKVEAMCMSTLTGEGVTEVKTAACDRLLAMRVEAKLRSGKVNDVLNRVTVGEPKPRDNKERYVSFSEGIKVSYVERSRGPESA